MNKPLLKRSTFIPVTLTDASILSILIEGDEAYITVMNNNSSNSVLVRRQRERDLDAALTSSALDSTNTALSKWGNVAYTYGAVSLDVPIVGGELQNLQITTAVGATAITERMGRGAAGFKEVIDLKASNASFPLNVLIETVSYVPAETIHA